MEFLGERKHDLKFRFDAVVEKEILRITQEYFSEFEVISEEEVSHGVPSKLKIIVDPIDGSVNAFMGIPFYATSIAIAYGDKFNDIIAGGVINLVTGELFEAYKGKGLFYNFERVKFDDISERRLVTSIYVSPKNLEALEKVRRILNLTRAFRTLGAVSLELALTAFRRIDLVVDIRDKLRSFDIAASYLMIREGEGLMVDKQGNDIGSYSIKSTGISIIASYNANLVKEVVNILKLY